MRRGREQGWRSGLPQPACGVHRAGGLSGHLIRPWPRPVPAGKRLLSPETSLHTVASAAVYGVILAAQASVRATRGVAGCLGSGCRTACIRRANPLPVPARTALLPPQDQYADAPQRVNEMRVYARVRRHQGEPSRAAGGPVGRGRAEMRVGAALPAAVFPPTLLAARPRACESAELADPSFIPSSSLPPFRAGGQELSGEPQRRRARLLQPQDRAPGGGVAAGLQGARYAALRCAAQHAVCCELPLMRRVMRMHCVRRVLRCTLRAVRTPCAGAGGAACPLLAQRPPIMA